MFCFFPLLFFNCLIILLLINVIENLQCNCAIILLKLYIILLYNPNYAVSAVVVILAYMCFSFFLYDNLKDVILKL